MTRGRVACVHVMCATVLSSLSVSSVANADDAEQRALITVAEAHERANEPRDALATWHAALAAAPTSRLARRCQTRIDYIRARSEGNFRPLVALMQMRQAGAAAQTRENILRFEAQARAMPPGLVRKESRIVAAEAWLTSVRDAREAIRAYRVLLSEENLDANERRAAFSSLAGAYSSIGDRAHATQAISQAGIGSSPAAVMIELEGKRRVGRVVAWSAIALFVLCATIACVRGGIRAKHIRRTFTIPLVGSAFFVALVPFVIARAYDHAAADTFSFLAACIVGVLFVSRVVGNVFDEKPQERAFVITTGLSSAASMLAAGYLLLDGAGGLISIGL